MKVVSLLLYTMRGFSFGADFQHLWRIGLGISVK